MRNLLLVILFLALALAVFAEERPHGPPATEPTALIETSMGTLRCKLLSQEAPRTVANFVGLAEGTKDWKDPVTGQTKRGTPLYNGTIFHRVIPDFMIQGGDPLGNGTGDPGYKFDDEIVPSLAFDRPGRMAMANAGPNTNGSQFFITEKATPWLNGHYNLFGQCDNDSIELVKQIARVPRDAQDKPISAVRINRIVIERKAPKAAPAAPRSAQQ